MKSYRKTAIFVGVLFLPIWLLVKGFNSSAIDSGSAKTDINEMKRERRLV